MRFTREQVAAVRQAYPDQFNEELAAEDAESLAEEVLTCMTQDLDIAYAWGPGEPYAITIRGTPGAYVIVASDFDPIGVFSTLKEAREAREDEWSGVALFDSEEDAQSYARDEGLL